MAISREAKDFRPRTVRLFYATDEERAARCRQLTAELRSWISGRGKTKRPYDGRLRSLIRIYQSVETDTSPYHRVQENTQRDYNQRLAVLEKVVGNAILSRLTAEDFERWYQGFKKPAEDGGPERIRKAHGIMTMLRILMSFGKSMRLPGCRECGEVLEAMRFKQPKKRKQMVTFEQAQAVVDLALADGRRSIALGQALQFELTLRQVDVIGKWTRNVAPGAGGIAWKGKRWGGGLLWSDLSNDLTLAKETTKTAADGEWDLSQYPLVMKALAAFPEADRIGPMIVSEKTGRPYFGEYSREWRPFATKAGIPRDVWNRDSRAGGITEGWDADADVKDLQRLATHSTQAMTERYARRALASTNRVAKLRVASRKQAGNKL
jgi:hypothetical protein